MDIAYAPCYVLDVPSNHRFPMEKYELLRLQLLHEGVASEEDFFLPEPIPESLILLAHNTDYWHRTTRGEWTRQEERASGFQWSEALILRERVIMQGTVDCAERALKSGTVALNIAGGTHHAFADRAEGFCLLNDFAIAAIHVINAQLATRVLIIDCDVHQGNGSASILSHHPDIVTFSMHGASNYPLHKEESDVDIALPDGTEDGEYLARLSNQLEALIPQDGQRPDLVMYQCGVDILGTDKLGKLSLTMRGCQKRDQLVFQRCADHRIPVVCAMGGGYSADVNVVVQAHVQTFRAALDVWT